MGREHFFDSINYINGGLSNVYRTAVQWKDKIIIKVFQNLSIYFGVYYEDCVKNDAFFVILREILVWESFTGGFVRVWLEG